MASSIATKSGLAMIEALIDGERRPRRLADLALGRMRSKVGDLAMARESRFADHHALMCRLHLDHIGHLEEMIAKLDAQIEAMMAPFRAERDLLTTIPAIGPLAAAAVLSEIGARHRLLHPPPRPRQRNPPPDRQARSPRPHRQPATGRLTTRPQAPGSASAARCCRLPS